MTTRSRMSWLLGVLLLFPAWHAADAQVAGAPCREDYRLYCAGVAQGGGRAIECLKEHAAQLSPACRGALIAARGPAPAVPATAPPSAFAPAMVASPPPSAIKAEVAQECGADIRRYCAGVPQGGGLIGQCLKEHAMELSPGCRGTLAEIRAPGPVAAPSPPPQSVKAAIGKACRPDIRTYCAGVPQGGGLIGQCLKDHAMQLSPDCRGALMAARASSPALPVGGPPPNMPPNPPPPPPPNNPQ